MGWARGSIVMDRVIAALQITVPDAVTRKAIYTALIVEFRDMDRDTENECTDQDTAFDDDAERYSAVVALNFKQQFIPPILSGAKRQTIRAIGRRRHAIPGETLQLYTGMRTKQCRLIGKAVCVSTEPIEMSFDGAASSVEIGAGQITRYLLRRDLDTFAMSDGFPDWPAMLAFWRETHPKAAEHFSGVIIEWGGFTAAGVGL